ncbi:hypothetical protein CRG98_023187 [Punica granatum]|uniref:FAE domain-containing protein n=1 Tax=Punica granatum TaxID=22663 RepID=A0A2I0JJK8_PUNGR|nr:hypothetical protein CRG98_023187 [Punica granatum]
MTEEQKARDAVSAGSVSVSQSQPKIADSKNKLPNFLLSVRLKYVKLGYHYHISNAMYLLLVPLLGTVYLVDFSCSKPKPKPARKCTRETIMEGFKLCGLYTLENLEFTRKVLERSGLGQETYVPESLLRISPSPCMADARMEAEAVVFEAIDELLARLESRPRTSESW